MKFTKKIFVFCLAATIGLLSYGAQAEKVMRSDLISLRKAPSQNCPLQETATVNVNLNSVETDPSVVRSIMDKKIEEATALGTQSGLEKVDVQSFSYNLNKNSSGGNCSAANEQYQFYGNINLQVSPASKAPDYMTLLQKSGFTASLSVNVYKQCQ